VVRQSTTTTVLRALVMLTFLVVIPSVAIFGDRWREMTEAWLDGPWPPAWLAAETTPEQDESIDDAPRFEPLGPQAQASMAPAFQPPEPFSAPPGAQPLHANPSRQDMQPSDAARIASIAEDGSSVVPTGYDSRQDAAADRSSQHPSPSHFSPAGEFFVSPPPGDERFAQMHERLRQLGATYVLLESWGEQHQTFRFYCKIAIAGNPHYTYRFEATDAEPIEAMAKVVAQIERWRAGQ